MVQISLIVSIIAVGAATYFVTNDSVELVIARFTPEGYEEIDRTSLIQPTLRTRGGRGDRCDGQARRARAP